MTTLASSPVRNARGAAFFTVLAGVILISGLVDCESFHVSGDPGHGGVLKRTADVVAVAAADLMTDSNDGAVRSAWQDASGMWHWTRVEPGVGTFRCEGYRLGVPKQCERTSSY